MRRLSQSNRKKGQWFLISAVIISGAFLTISVMLKDYMVLDQSAVIKMDEDFYFNEIKEKLYSVIDYEDCDKTEKNINEYIVFAKEKMAEKGYYLHLEVDFDCEPELPPSDIMLIIDRSGSMRETKIADAKDAAKAFVNLTDPSKHRIGLVSWSNI